MSILTRGKFRGNTLNIITEFCPEEVATLFHFLASGESSFITGVAIPIDGGLSASIGMGIIEPMPGVIMGGDSS